MFHQRASYIQYSRPTTILIFSSIFQDLLACLAPTEVQQMLDELASDPDDKHVPASVRNAYRCEKQPTGPLDHTSLVSHIKVSYNNIHWTPVMIADLK